MLNRNEAQLQDSRRLPANLGNISFFCKCRPLNGSSSTVIFNPSMENEIQIICSDSGPRMTKMLFVGKFHPYWPQCLMDTTSVFFLMDKRELEKSIYNGRKEPLRIWEWVTEHSSSCSGFPRSNYMRCELSVSMLEVYNEKISVGSLILILWRRNNFVLAQKKELFWACFWIRRFYTFCYEGTWLAHALLTSFGRLKEGLLVSLGKISEYYLVASERGTSGSLCVFVSSGGSWSKRKIKRCLVLHF